MAVFSIVTVGIGGHLSVFENKTMDARYRYFAARTAHTDDILILDITEESLKRLEPVYGRWPWPRSVHADVVSYLDRSGASAVGFDIIFSERNTKREIGLEEVSEFISYVRNSDIPEVRAALLEKLGSLGSHGGDERFAEASRKSGRVFQSAVFYADLDDLRLNPGIGSDGKGSAAIVAAMAPSAAPITLSGKAYFNATVPFEGLASASRGTGHINFAPDKDGVCRRFTPLLSFKSDKTAYPALSVLIGLYVKGVSPKEMRLEGKRLVAGDSVLPLLPDGRAYIAYQGGKVEADEEGKTTFKSFYRHIPIEYVLASIDAEASGTEPPIPPETFKDRIVLVTASAVGLADLRTTPFSPVTPGMEIHANVIDSILSGKFLTEPDRRLTLSYTLLLAFSVAVFAAIAGPIGGFIIVTALLGLTASVHWGLFGRGYVLPIVQPVFAMAGTYLGSMLLKYVTEFREKRFLRTAFGHYMAPAVLEEILRSPEKLRLGGERRRMTVLFSDIEGFSTISEKLPPEQISSVLNNYLTSMVECIIRTNGSVDKFIGDAVMAFWNAPVEEKEHAALACEAALRMVAASRGRGPDGGQLNSRIGINTGEMVVGNMGSNTIFDYTVIGSEVNVASRLEPLNKDFGTRIAVSETTRRASEEARPGRFVYRHMADVVLKGMKTPLGVHELVGFAGEVDAKAMEAIGKFEKGLELYRSGRFSEARELFSVALSALPDDGPSKTYLSLCERHIASPPEGEWQGIYIQLTK